VETGRRDPICVAASAGVEHYRGWDRRRGWRRSLFLTAISRITERARSGVLSYVDAGFTAAGGRSLNDLHRTMVRKMIPGIYLLVT
jgi:hypothetical protein